MSKRNLAPKPLASKPLVPKPLVPKPTPTFYSQNQRPFSNFEMELDPSLLMECRTVRPNIPFQERVENDMEIHPYEESIPVDDNLIDLTVSINEIFILIYLLFSYY
jgi:hypothetical protein